MLAAAGATPGPEQVGVLVVGGDAAQAGRIQSQLEASLGRLDRVDVVGIDRLAPVLAGETAAAPDADPARVAEAAARIEAARDAFYRGKHPVAMKELRAAKRLHDQLRRPPVKQEIRWWLWRGAVAQAVSRTADAERSVRQALRLDPDLQVSLTEFKPSLSALVEQVRRKPLRRVEVRIGDLPTGAVVDVDDRRVGETFRVLPGRHWIVVSAPGRRAVGLSVDLQGNARLSIPLALSVDPEVQAGAADGDAQAIESARRKLGLDTLLVVAIARPARGRVLIQSSQGSVRHEGNLSSRQDVSALARWAAKQIQDYREDRFVVESRRARLQAHVEGGPAYGRLTRKLASPSGLSLVMPFNGTGPALSGEVAYGRFVADGDASWIYYGLSEVETVDPDNTTLKILFGGGHAANVRGSVGYRHQFGTPEVSPSLLASVGMRYRRYDGESQRTVTQRTVRIVSSYQQTAVEGRLAGEWPVALGSWQLVFEGAGAVSPWSSWQDDTGFNGRSPSVLTGYAWDAGVRIAPTRGRWRVETRYHGEDVRVQYRGVGSIETTPASVDARLGERVHVVSIGARWGF